MIRDRQVDYSTPMWNDRPIHSSWAYKLSTHIHNDIFIDCFDNIAALTVIVISRKRELRWDKAKTLWFTPV